MTGTKRRACGPLFLVALVVLATTLVIGAARATHGGGARANVEHATLAATGRDLCRSAIEEAFVELGHRANQPGKLFDELRNGGAITPFTLDPMLTRAGLDPSDFRLAPVQVTVKRVRQVGLKDYEWEGVLRVVARCRNDAHRLATALAAERTFRVAHVSTPSTLGALTLLVLDASSLVPPGTNEALRAAAQWIAKLQTHLPELAGKLEQVVAAIDTRIAAADAQSGGRYATFDGAALVTELRSVSLPPVPDLTEEVTAPAHLFPRDYMVGSGQPQVDLAKLALLSEVPPGARTAADAVTDFQGRVADLTAAMEEALQAAGQEIATAQATQAEQQADRIRARLTSTVHAVRKAADSVARSQQAVIERVCRFQQAWGEAGGDYVVRNRGALAFLHPDEWRRRATHRFEGATAGADAVAFLRRYAAAARPLSAVIFVDAPLELSDLALRGRISIMATGKVSLSEVRLGPQDLLVVQAVGPMTVRGHVDASLLAMGGFEAAPEVHLSGPLVLYRAGQLPAGGTVDSAGGRYHVPGHVGAPEHLAVDVSPWTEKIEVL